MKNKPGIRPYIVRLLAIALISAVGVTAFNEGTYLIQKDKTDRPPKTIQLVIPAGTAARLAAGESVQSIPDKMVFVMGDVLEVKNEDSVAHQLGPVWVPAGATGRLALNEPNKYTYSCSFSTSRFLGLDVRKPTTLATRLTALIFATPPMTTFLFIYSLLVYPIKPKAKQAAEQVG